MARLLPYAAMAASMILLLPAAHAALGGLPDAAQAGAAQQRTASRDGSGPGNARGATASYTLHERVDAAGTMLREYAGADGKVFAVSWDGPAKPNLRTLLGDYFTQYTAGAGRLKQSSHHRDALATDKLVVRSSAHLRSFTGLAYIPGALPTGVTPEDLQ